MKLLFLIFFLLIVPLYGAPYSETPIDPWGADCDLCPNNLKNWDLGITPKKKTVRTGRKICCSMIHFFQNVISPIDGPRSSFYPTSSQYALDAILKYGVLKGIALGCDRLMRENKELWVYETTKKHGMERKLDPVR